MSHGAYTQLLPLLEDGVVFDFRHVQFSRERITIPLLALHERFIPDGIFPDETARKLGKLVLMRQKNQWLLDPDRNQEKTEKLPVAGQFRVFRQEEPVVIANCSVILIEKCLSSC